MRTKPQFHSEEDSFPGSHRFAHQAMATIFEIYCAHEDRGYSEQAASAAFDLVSQIEMELTCHRASSDISRINRMNPGDSTRVGLWTMEVLLLAQHFYSVTGGAFDVALGSGLESVELNPADFSVTVQAPDVRLDLGGIGKGYAIDRAGELLGEWEIERALLHAGFSSVLALEAPPDRVGWFLTISLPSVGHAPVLARFQARREAWSASGIRKKDHILNPRTGSPVNTRVAAWVYGGLESLLATARIAGIANSPSAVAEVLSTAFMILPVTKVAEFCQEHPGVEARWLEMGDTSCELICCSARGIVSDLSISHLLPAGGDRDER